jgi:hypothetical protein
VFHGARLLLLAAVLGFALGALARPAIAENLRLRFAWGGGPERLWQGRIAVSEGVLAEPVALGVETDEVGSMWMERGQAEISLVRGDRTHARAPARAADGYLAVRQRSPRTYDAVDLSVTAPAEATLLVEFEGVDDKRHPGWLEIRLADVLHGSFSADLDDQGNRLVVRRSPGDELRVRLPRRSLVYAPGETLKFELEPHLLAAEPGSKMKIKVQLCAARTSQEIRAEEYPITVGQSLLLPVEVPLSVAEGAYDVVITAATPAKIPLPHSVRAPLGLKTSSAERTIQVLVLNPQPRPDAAGEPRLSVVQEIDPANPKWWAKFAGLPSLPRLPKLSKGPLGNGMFRPWQHPLGQLAQLAPSANSGDVSWEAYPLPRPLRPGEPYVLEVDYPSDVPQTLGISIIEPNAAGAVIPVGLDSGIDQAEEVTGLRSPPQWLRHRIIFWPRTESPVVLITNLRDRRPAAYGKIRVLAGWQHLPRTVSAGGPKPARLWAGYMDRPLVPENFSASEAIGSTRDLSVDDWVTFHEGGTRLVEYLQHVGYNGLMLSVLADGSTIYPSAIVEPTPRYDTGAFLATGQDPVRKDVLEMLLRLFDREGLQLVPAMEFASPLPELEAVLRRGGPDAVGITWVGPEGTSWQEVRPSLRGRSPYYNVLHPRVQEAMLAVIRELASTYGRHPSFAGLGLQLSSHGYAQLLGPAWGVDDATVARFQSDTNVRVPGEGSERFLERARFLNGEGRNPWLEWRAAQLSGFYHRVRAELAAVRKDLPLYLAATDLFSNPDLGRELQPALPQKATVAETLLRVGLDARHYGPGEGILLVRPERISPASPLARRAIDLEIQQMPDVDRYFQGSAMPGCLFFHQPQEFRIPSFDEKCPFKPCYTWLASHPVPSAWQNRRRFVHSLATLDAQVMFDGGWLLPMGQEEAVRDLVAVYRQLPPARLEPVTDHAGPAAGQPVTVRCGTWNDRTYAYAVNDAPFAATVRIRVDGPAGFRLENLPGARPAGPLRRDADGANWWEMELGPYDLVAGWFSAPGVRLYKPLVSWPDEVRSELEKRLSDLGYRAAALRSSPPLEVLVNASFDQPPGPQGQIPGWIPMAPPGVTIRIDKTSPHDGPQSVRLASTGPAGGLVSRAFAPPATGRLAVSVWLRTADAARQPPFALVVEGKMAWATFRSFFELGQAAADQRPVRPIPAGWGHFIFPVNDLPLEALGPVSVRFELLGPGEVWIDDVQLCELAFSRDEQRELLKLITPAPVHLQNGQIADCIRLLEGYWPQFLVEYVRLAEAPATRRAEPAANPARPPQEAERSSGLMDRLKNFVPHRLRF